MEFFAECMEEIEYLFPSPPVPSDAAPPVDSCRSDQSQAIVTATLLSGEHCSIAYHPQRLIDDAKMEIERELNIPASKQKLFFGDVELTVSFWKRACVVCKN